MNKERQEKIVQWYENNKDATFLNRGSFKSAHKYDNETVLTFENIQPGASLKLPDYIKLMGQLYSLEEPLLKNLLLPTEYFQARKDGMDYRIQLLPFCHSGGYSDLFDFLSDPDEKGVWKTLNKTDILKNCASILRTIYELHKRNISCLDIKPENVFVGCEGKNLLSLGDVDGFQIFENKEKMYKHSRCVTTSGYFVAGKKGYNIQLERDYRNDLMSWRGMGLGGPQSDYYAWLVVFLMVYMRIVTGSEKAYASFFGNFAVESYGINHINNTHGYKTDKFNKNYKNALTRHMREDELLKLLLIAIEKCKNEVMYLKQSNYYYGKDDGPENFYNDFIKPIIDKANVLTEEWGLNWGSKIKHNAIKKGKKALESIKKLVRKKSNQSLKTTEKGKENVNPGQVKVDIGGGRKRRKRRTKKNKKRHTKKKRRRKRKRTKKRRRK